MYSCFNGYNRLYGKHASESIIIKALSELAEELNLQVCLSDHIYSSWYNVLQNKKYVNLILDKSTNREISYFSNNTNREISYFSNNKDIKNNINSTKYIKKSINNKAYFNHLLNKKQIILYNNYTIKKNISILTKLYKYIKNTSIWNSGKLLLKPIDLMKGFGILYIDCNKDNFNIDLFIDTIINHIH